MGGSQDTTTATAANIGLSSYSNLSLRVGIRWKKLEAAVFVKNLNDTTLQLLKFQQTGITYATSYNQPRTIGANLIYRW